VIVSSVIKNSPAEGRLHAGDVIKAVDGAPVKAPQDVAKLVTKHKPGQKVIFSIVPAARAKVADQAGHSPQGTEQVGITTEKSDDKGPARAVVGIAAATDHTFPFTVDIKLADVGGPSAGLMFSLGIVDKLTPGSLTGGKFVAGTGTIDDQGKVGPIGGIALKLIAARSAGAQYFFTPADNCADAADDPPAGLRLIKVNSIADALKALSDIRSGNTSSLPSCSAS
jgi:PDZ domain-containing protein